MSIGLHPAIAPPRTTWADAGGAAPSLSAIYDLGGGLTQPSMGTGAVRDSSFTRIGKEVFATCRIIWGASPTIGAGLYGIAGLPVGPKINTGQGRHVGDGFIVDPSDSGKALYVNLVLDPFFSTTVPFMWLHAAQATVSATTVLVPALTGGSPSPFVTNANPWVPAEGDIINLRLQYEGV